MTLAIILSKLKINPGFGDLKEWEMSTSTRHLQTNPAIKKWMDDKKHRSKREPIVKSHKKRFFKKQNSNRTWVTCLNTDENDPVEMDDSTIQGGLEIKRVRFLRIDGSWNTA